MTDSFDVIIVGGGMGGLVLAEILSHKGYRTAILERQPQFTPLPRGEIIQPNGLRILNELGFLEEIKTAGPHLNHVFHFCRVGGSRLCTIDYRMLPPPYNYSLILLPEMLIPALLKRLSNNHDVRIYWGTEFQSLLKNNGQVEGVVAGSNMAAPVSESRGSSSRQPFQLMAPMVIGADGIFSKVRNELGVRYRVKKYHHGYLTMLVRRPKNFGPEVRYYVGRKTILGFFPVSDTRLYLFYLVSSPPNQNLNDPHRDQARELDILKKAIHAIDPVAEEGLEEITDWGQVAYMPCARVRADRWVADGAALMGDAAHAMNPHVSQGRNQALEDAMALRDVLDECFRRGDFSQQALSVYEKNRRKRVERLQRLADEQVFFWNAGDPFRTWLRDRVFGVLDQNTRLRYRMLAQVAGLEVRPYSLIDRLMASGFVPDFRAHKIH